MRWNLFKAGLPIAGLCLFTTGAMAGNIVVNGDFSGGNTGFTTGYNLAVSNNCWPETTYNVVVNPQNCHSLWSSFGDHTTGTGNMMVVNGATSANVSVWSETVTVAANTAYDFSAWVASVYPSSPAVLDFSINGVQVGSDFTASTTPGLWQEFTTPWNSGVNTTAVLNIVDRNTAASGNDFALDDISLGNVAPTPEPGYFVFTGIAMAGLLVMARRRKAISAE